MGRHRLEPVRPRYGRMVSAFTALAVTLVAVLGGLGLAQEPTRGAGTVATASAGLAVPEQLPPDNTNAVPQSSGTGTDAAAGPAAESAGDLAGDPAPGQETVEPEVVPGKSLGPTERPARRVAPSATRPDALPADSGKGRRVVFSQSAQRVWLVPRGNRVERTYLVSGSVYDNLDPGTYSVFSRSENAVGIDDSGTMKYFVRFTRGENAAIGFHDIPVHRGAPVQTLDELGTPLSHGCIRQKREDAIALWEFAPLGTAVVVTP